MTPNGTYERLAPRLGSVSAMLCVLFCCNAATPYLGLKTDVSIAMFSNLRTEGAYWNHLVIPSDVRIFDLQDEPIMIVGTTSPHFAGFIEDPQWLVEEDLREMVQFVASGQDAPIWLEIEQAGRIRVVPDARVDPVLGQPVGPVAAKLTRFRKIPAAVNVCTH